MCKLNVLSLYELFRPANFLILSFIENVISSTANATIPLPEIQDKKPVLNFLFSSYSNKFKSLMLGIWLVLDLKQPKIVVTKKQVVETQDDSWINSLL